LGLFVFFCPAFLWSDACLNQVHYSAMHQYHPLSAGGLIRPRASFVAFKSTVLPIFDLALCLWRSSFYYHKNICQAGRRHCFGQLLLTISVPVSHQSGITKKLPI
jgi:hypothetical protein